MNRWIGALFIVSVALIVVGFTLSTIGGGWWYRPCPNEWAYARPYRSNAERLRQLPRWLYRYNHRRPHGGVGGAVPASRLCIEESLIDIKDNEGLYVTGFALDMASNVVGVALAAAVYLLFRGRDRVLALVAFAGLLAATGTFMMVDVGGLTLHRLADDLVEGGAGGAGDAEVLELARTVAWMTAYTAGVSFTFLGAALVVLGALLVRSPLSGGATEAASTIPRWVGWLAVVSGLLTLLFWLAAIDEALFLIAAIGLIGGLLTQLAVAWWLLKAAPEPAAVD